MTQASALEVTSADETQDYMYNKFNPAEYEVKTDPDQGQNVTSGLAHLKYKLGLDPPSPHTYRHWRTQAHTQHVS